MQAAIPGPAGTETVVVGIVLLFLLGGLRGRSRSLISAGSRDNGVAAEAQFEDEIASVEGANPGGLLLRKQVRLGAHYTGRTVENTALIGAVACAVSCGRSANMLVAEGGNAGTRAVDLGQVPVEMVAHRILQLQNSGRALSGDLE